MNNPIDLVTWKVKSKTFDTVFERDGPSSVMPLAGGFEAEVLRIFMNGSGFVLKKWNKTIKPDVESQYNLMAALFNRGMPVPEPLAWGTDQDRHPVLLTSFNGEPVGKVNEPLLAMLAKQLSGIHKISLEESDTSKLRKQDFISFFFPWIRSHPDLIHILIPLIERSDMKQDRIIHGDLNMGNVLQEAEKYTIIDWTDGQPGDPRYDIAWSVISVWIYSGADYASFYRSAFLSETNYTTGELEMFEAMACIRWLLINRIIDLGTGKDTIARVKGILKDNRYLSEKLIN